MRILVSLLKTEAGIQLQLLCNGAGNPDYHLFFFFFGKVIKDELSVVVTHAPTTTLQSYLGLYFSPGVRYLKSVKCKNYFYDVGNPLRYFFFSFF